MCRLHYFEFNNLYMSKPDYAMMYFIFSVLLWSQTSRQIVGLGLQQPCMLEMVRAIDPKYYYCQNCEVL